MSVLNPVQADALAEMDGIQVSERTEHKTARLEGWQEHKLLPGEQCVCLDDPNLSTDAVVGVVVRTATENDHSCWVMFAREPVKLFSRQRLLWIGALD